MTFAQNHHLLMCNQLCLHASGLYTIVRVPGLNKQINESINSLLNDCTNPQVHSPVSPVSQAPFERFLAPVSLRSVPNRSSPVYVNHIG